MIMATSKTIQQRFHDSKSAGPRKRTGCQEPSARHSLGVKVWLANVTLPQPPHTEKHTYGAFRRPPGVAANQADSADNWRSVGFWASGWPRPPMMVLYRLRAASKVAEGSMVKELR